MLAGGHYFPCLHYLQHVHHFFPMVSNILVPVLRFHHFEERTYCSLFPRNVSSLPETRASARAPRQTVSIFQIAFKLVITQSRVQSCYGDETLEKRVRFRFLYSSSAAVKGTCLLTVYL